MPHGFPTARQLYGLTTKRTWTDQMGSSEHDVFKGKLKIGEVHGGMTCGWTWTDYEGKHHGGWASGRETMNDALSCVYDAWAATQTKKGG